MSVQIVETVYTVDSLQTTEACVLVELPKDFTRPAIGPFLVIDPKRNNEFSVVFDLGQQEEITVPRETVVRPCTLHVTVSYKPPQPRKVEECQHKFR